MFENTAKILQSAYDHIQHKSYNDALSSIVEAQEKINSPWIDINKEYPEAVDGNKILGFGSGYAFECEFEDGFWCNIGGEDMTHWMPLPETPQK